MVVEDSKLGVIVPNLTEYDINKLDDVVSHIIEGNKRRIMATTRFN